MTRIGDSGLYTLGFVKHYTHTKNHIHTHTHTDKHTDLFFECLLMFTHGWPFCMAIPPIWELDDHIHCLFEPFPCKSIISRINICFHLVSVKFHSFFEQRTLLNNTRWPNDQVAIGQSIDASLLQVAQWVRTLFIQL